MTARRIAVVTAGLGKPSSTRLLADRLAQATVDELARAGVQRYRIELVRETAADVTHLVTAYRRAIEDPARSSQVWRELRTEGGYGVVRGSLRVIA